MDRGRQEPSRPLPQRRNPAVLERQRLQANRAASAKQRLQRPAAPPYRRPTVPPRRAVPVAEKVEEPEERFRDVLWADVRGTVAQKWTASLCALLYALAYVLCFRLLNHPLNVLTARMPGPLSAFLRAFLPSAAGTLLCALTRVRFPDEPRMMLWAYRKLVRWILFVFLALQILIWGEWAAQRTLALFVIQFVVGPLLVGAGAAVLFLYLDWAYADEDEDES